MSSGKLPPPLSPQQVAACDTTEDGCNGGNPPEAVQYLEQCGGIESARSYPYTASNCGKESCTGKCKYDHRPIVKVSGFTWAVPECNSGTCKSQESQLAAKLARHGPISICLNAGNWDNWEGSYPNGWITATCKAEARLIDHCVQLVGYDKDHSTPYWLIRNSWGTSWGQNGFIKLPMGHNACCVGCEALIISASMESSNSGSQYYDH